MKRMMGVVVAFGAVAAAWAGPDMRSGRPSGAPPPLPAGSVPTTVAPVSVAQPPDDEPVTPLAITVFEWGVPFSRGWDVYGVRVNTCLPGWSAGHNDIYGIDFGVSGEITGDAAGVCCNFFDNICNNFGGVQIGGIYNRIKGDAPIALQATLVHNRADTMNGLQMGCWNVASKVNGMQIGLLFNHADGGAGIQIGLWNECGTHGSPIIGAVF